MNKYERMEKYSQTCRETKYYHINGQLCKMTGFSHLESNYTHPDDKLNIYDVLLTTDRKNTVKFYIVRKHGNVIRKAFVSINKKHLWNNQTSKRQIRKELEELL